MPDFVKSHGLGNDYLVVDPVRLPFALTPAAIRLLCDRHLGVGSDGVLAVSAASGDQFALRIYNPDGTEAEKSGNGVRIVAKFLREHGYTPEDRFSIQTPGGRVGVVLEVAGNAVREVAADMGRASILPISSLEVDGERLEVTALSLGNPHCVIIVPDLDAIDLPRIGPLIERHPAFPRRTNVQFARVSARDAIDIRIWERGAGPTLASGTSALAAAVACHDRGLVDDAVTVTMPGGSLRVEISPTGELRLRGPVEEIAAGDLSSDFLRRIAAIRTS